MAPKEMDSSPDTPMSSGSTEHAVDIKDGHTQQSSEINSVQPSETSTASKSQHSLKLPLEIVSRSDVSRCLRELNVVEDYFHQASLRGSKDQALPELSQLLEIIAGDNDLNLIHSDQRDSLKQFLTQVKSKGPSVHMSFPSTPSKQFVGKLLTWFRDEVHEFSMLHVGLQPELAAGCTLRTTNRAFDFSFRKRFEQSKQKLLTAIEELDKMPERTVVASATATVDQELQL